MMVKICGVTVREDALAAANAGAGAIGFNFYPASPRYIDRDRASEIGAGLPLTKVGIFVNEAPERVKEIMEAAALDIAQVYGDRSYTGLRTWRACRVQSADFALPDDGDAEAFLLDGFAPGVYGGSGQMFPWWIARSLPRPVVLAGGLDPDNVRDAIAQAQPWGVDACSRIETSPGRKDRDKMKRFIEAALEAALAVSA